MASEWLIIGGGIHGTHLSLHLTQRGGVKPQHIRVVDPHPAPLSVWGQVTRAVSMEYLRSPLVHNLHWDQGSLGLFSRLHQQESMTRFIPPFGRPSLALFNAHAAHLIQKFGLDQLRLQARANRLARCGDRWSVETDKGVLHADRVVIAIGLSEQPFWPDWARPFKTSRALRHVFSPDFVRTSIAEGAAAIVVGGGITAAQTALALADRSPGSVVLVRRHDERVFDFDSDVGWMNAMNLRGFAQITDWDQRRRVIRSARHRGSIPSDVAVSLDAAVQAGVLHIVDGEVHSLREGASLLELTMRSGLTISADHLVLATGYVQSRPGGDLVDCAVNDFGFPTASCGYPTPTPRLEWAPGLYVSGPLAELEVGPASRNIVGARMAGQRLIESC